MGENIIGEFERVIKRSDKNFTDNDERKENT